MFQEVCRLLGIRKTRTTPLHPQSDGLVERFNRTLTTQLAILTSEHQRDWDRHIPPVLWAYRTAVQESTGCTPAALMFGRELRTPVELVFGPPPEPEIPGVPGLEYLQKLRNRLHVVHEGARNRQEAASAKQKRAYDVHSNKRDFASGDRVWVYSPKRKRGYSPKLYSHWQGPCEVLAKISDVVYRVKLGGRRQRTVVLHRDRLAPYHPMVIECFDEVSEEDVPQASTTPQGVYSPAGEGRPQRQRRPPRSLRDYVCDVACI